jgi:hypothetical protein
MEKIGIEFKLIIAYLVPGCIALYAIGMYVPTVAALLGSGTAVPSGSSIIIVLVLAIACGIIVNAITWLCLRPLIELTSRRRPPLDYSLLSDSIAKAYQEILENNYRYYQSYSNMFTSLVILIAAALVKPGEIETFILISCVLVCCVLFLAARDSLIRTYDGMERLLGNLRGETDDKRKSGPVGSGED